MIIPGKYLNLGLLLVGFGLGQGSLFLANTFLFWGGHYELVAHFGAANAMATFFYFFGDWGGLIYIAKEAVSSHNEEASIETKFLSLSIFRLVIGILFIISIFIYYSSLVSVGFLGEYIKWASLGLVFYAFNASGLLDGSGRSGISGMSQALPAICVAIALPLFAKVDDLAAGRSLGLLYSSGVAVSVICQYFFGKIALRSAIPSISPRSVLASGWASLPYMLTPLPGQILFRGQVLLATHFLTSDLVALFIYCRQIIGIGYQGLGFYLRVDIRDFADRLRSNALTSSEVILSSMTTRIGAIATVVAAIGALVLIPFRPQLSYGLLIYSPCIVALAVSATMQRALVLRSYPVVVVGILFATNIVPIGLFVPIFNQNSIQSLVLIELVSLLLQSVLFVLFWRRLIESKGARR